MNRVLTFYLFLGCLFASAACSSKGVTPLMYEKADGVIKKCKELCADVLKSRNLLVEELARTKKPGFCSAKRKHTYNEKLLHLKTFDDNFADFIAYIEKIDLAAAHTPEELAAILEPYSSNCLRFGTGLLGFTKWALGQGPAGFDRIYNQWVLQSREITAKLKHRSHFGKLRVQ